MIRARFSFWQLVVVLSAAFFVAQGDGARAHKLPCGHTHSNKFVITCNTNGAACTTNGAAGKCKTVQYRNALACECIPNKKGGGGCLATGVYAFSDQGDGPPTQDTSIIYLAETGPEAKTFVLAR